MLILSPILMLALLEWLLWVFDVAPPEEAKDPHAARTQFAQVFDADTLNDRMAIKRPQGRVVCLGGSTMAGTPFEYKLTMCNLAGEALGREVEVINMAGSGNDSANVLALGEIVCRHPQTLVLVYSGHNEFLHLGRFLRGKPPEPVLAMARFFSRFRFYRLIKRLLKSEKPASVTDLGEVEVSDAEVFSTFRKNMRQLLTACKGKNVVLSTVISNPAFRFPAPGRTIRESLRREGPASARSLNSICRYCYRAAPPINDAIRELAAELDVPLVDASGVLGGEVGHEQFWDHVHPKPEVHRKLAQAMLDAAATRGWIPAGRKARYRLDPEQRQWAEMDRALYNVQFDPEFALRRLEAMRDTRDPVARGLGIAISGFLLDRKKAIARGFGLARTALADDQHRRRWAACAGADGQPPQRRQDGPDHALTCFHWRSGVLMSPAEKAELVAAAEEAKDPVVLKLMKEF